MVGRFMIQRPPNMNGLDSAPYWQGELLIQKTTKKSMRCSMLSSPFMEGEGGVPRSCAEIYICWRISAGTQAARFFRVKRKNHR
jgi:hypothetical protein